MAIKIHILKHADFEGPGYIEKWAQNNSHDISFTNLYLKEKLPNLNDLDFLVIMGGPMSVNDTDKIDWLEYELKFIKDAIDEGKVVLGICLGSQLIAKALNSTVYPAKSTEVGWFPVMFNKKELSRELKEILPDYITTLHWHGETFDIPRGAIGFGSSTDTPNQAFIYNEKVLGLQFHPETTVYTIEGFIENMGNDIQEGRYIQPIGIIRKGAEYIIENNQLLDNLISYLSSRIY